MSELRRSHSRRLMLGLRALLAIVLLGAATLAAAAPKIGLLTMDPGETYWARFGHNALLVVEDDRAISYNFGYFDFEQPGFLARFLRGDMRYLLVDLPYQTDLANYAAEGRRVRVQWLSLSDAQSSALALALATNARPENAEYRYDYFTSNCSTKVRDALDTALGGELQRQSTGRSHGLTWRAEALRLSGPLPWMALGIHLGLGPATDQPMSRWEEAYIPARLAATVREIRIDGRPLVHSEAELLPRRIAPPPEAPPRWLIGFCAASVLLLALLAQLQRPAGTARQRAGVVTVALLWGFCGIAGVGMLLLWLATAHSAAWSNSNLLLTNPLCLLLLGAVPALWRGAPAARWLVLTAAAVAVVALLAMLHSWLAVRGQQMREWIVLLLPAHALLAYTLQRRSNAGQSAE